MSEPAGLRIFAPAKINLFLRVNGKRQDGYHELQTWMHKISLGDQLVLELSGPGIELECEGEQVPGNEDNLAFRAAGLFLDRTDKKKSAGVRIRLAKNIPVSAGLGGGSSDAGAVLKGLNKLFGQPLSACELLELALELGADVPFFTADYDAVWATGVGEKMVPLPPLPETSLVLVNPGISVATKWVFENFVLTENSQESTVPCPSEMAGSALDMMVNDLEAVTANRYPVIGEIKDALLEAGAKHVLMSGSGPTVFSLFPDDDEKGCFQVEDAVRVMRLRFDKVYKAKTIAGAWPSGQGTGF